MYYYIPGLTRRSQELFKMLPYAVTLLVLIVNSMKSSRDKQPPHSLGLAYFREER
jgi:simple sugar transport system permease protein